MVSNCRKSTQSYAGIIVPFKDGEQASLSYATTIRSKSNNKQLILKAEGRSISESIQKLIPLAALVSVKNASFTSVELSTFTESNHTIVLHKNTEMRRGETYFSANVYEHNNLKERITDTSIDNVISRLYTFLSLVKIEELNCGK